MSTKVSISCLIVEDEPIAQGKLINYVKNIPALELIGAAANAQQALQLANKQPDLVFLDINMPQMSGYDLMRQWPAPLPLIIVTSAFEEYALEGYKFSVLDYLVKPVLFKDVAEAVRKAYQRLQTSQLDNHWEGQYAKGSIQEPENLLPFKVGTDLINVPLNDISYCEACNNYTKVNTTKKYFMIRLKISRVEEILPVTDFLRISRSHIVRKKLIRQIKGNTIYLVNNVELPVGITYREIIDEYKKKTAIG
jgi:two-component system LytT family response regulator